MSECVFCSIAKKEIPATIIYETKHVLCFLDIHPLARGHCLLIPKKHYRDLFDMPRNEFKQYAEEIQTVVQILRKQYKASGVNLLHASGKAAQQSVFHLHTHLVPRHGRDGLDLWPAQD